MAPGIWKNIRPAAAMNSITGPAAAPRAPCGSDQMVPPGMPAPRMTGPVTIM